MDISWFLAKNQLPSVLSDSISLPSLSGEDVYPLLCTSRAPRIYMDRVYRGEKVTKGCLFLIWIHMRKEFHVILPFLSYESNNLNQVRVNAHEVSALSSSWAWSNKVPLDEVVKVFGLLIIRSLGIILEIP